MPLTDHAGSTLPAARRTADPADPGSAPPRSRRYPELDVLRFLAAAAVVCYHFLFRATATSPYMSDVGIFDPLGLARYGYLGVDLFFVISGFVIVLSAIGKTPSGFLISRFTRLYPAFWVAATLTALITFAAPGTKFQSSPGTWLVNLTMTPDVFGASQVDGVYWTLLVELKFYLLVLVLSLVGITARRLFGLAAAWTAFSALSHIVPMPGWLDSLLVPEWSPYFAAGICFALAARFGWRRRYGLLVTVTLVLALIEARTFNEGLAAKLHRDYSMPVVLGLTILIFAVVAALTVRRVDRPWVRRVAVLGGLTYPLYLVHQNIGYTIIDNLQWLPPGIRLGIALGCAVGLAWLLHRYVELRLVPWLSARLTTWWARVRPPRVARAEERIAAAPLRELTASRR